MVQFIGSADALIWKSLALLVSAALVLILVACEGTSAASPDVPRLATKSPPTTTPVPSLAPTPTFIPEAPTIAAPAPAAIASTTAIPSPTMDQAHRRDPSATTRPASHVTPRPMETPVPRPAATPRQTSAATPTAMLSAAIQPSLTISATSGEHVYWIAVDLPAVLNSPALGELRSKIKENTVYDLDFVAVSEQLARINPAAAEVVGQYIEHDNSQESVVIQYLDHRGHWIEYYGKLDQQTVLDHPIMSSLTDEGTHGGYNIFTYRDRHQEGYKLAIRGAGTFPHGTTETPKAALGKAHDGFLPAPAEAARVLSELGDQHLLVEARTSPERIKKQSNFDLKQLSAWDDIPPWTSRFGSSLTTRPTPGSPGNSTRWPSPK